MNEDSQSQTNSTDQPISEQSDQVLVQLRRIRGQLDGVLRMYEDERTCIDIVRQLLAIRNSVSSVARSVLADEASRCSRTNDPEQLDAVVKEVLKF
jgi:DNA-binding FrmR family transcriptional regulator